MNRKLLFLLILFAGITGISGCGNLHKFSGRITDDITWKGRIILEGDVYVEPKAKLTILEGTRIYYTGKEIKNEIQRIRNLSGNTYDIFKEGKIELIIAGDLDIRGTEERPVFISAPVKNPGRAGGISFIGFKSTSAIKHLIIKGGYIGIRLFDERSPLIEKTIITGNDVSAIGCWDRSKPEIRGVEIYENKYGIGVSDLACPVIINSKIKNNKASGIFFEGASMGIISNSIISGNNVGVAFGDESEAGVILSTISANGSGIGCWDKSSPKIQGNRFLSNIAGVLFLDESSGKVEDNDFIMNGGGITVSDNSSGEILKNRFEKNGPAVIVAGNAKPEIHNNYLAGNEYGVMVENRSKPRIYSNTFKENRLGIMLTDYSRPDYYDNIFKDNLNDTADSRLNRKK